MSSPAAARLGGGDWRALGGFLSALELLWGWVRLLAVLDGTMWVRDGLTA